MRDITSEIVSINIYKAASEVLNTLVRKDIEVAAEGNRWFMVRILPYRTVDFMIEGVVLTFSEITELKNALNEYESLESLAAGIVNSIRTPFVVLDTGLKVKVANGPFYELFKVRDVETIDKPIYELGSGQWDIDLLKRALGDIVEKNSPLINFEVEYDFPQIGHRKMILNGSRIEKSKYVYLSIENTAEQDT
jgi:two-component system CheB/CheR fusion protein